MRRLTLSIAGVIVLAGCGGGEADNRSESTDSTTATETSEAPRPGSQNYESLAELHAAILDAGVACGPLVEDPVRAPDFNPQGRCTLQSGELVLYLWPDGEERTRSVNSMRDAQQDTGYCMVAGRGQDNDGAWSIDALADRDACRTLSLELPGLLANYELPPPPPAFNFECFGQTLSGTAPKFTSLEQIWAAATTEELSSCSVEVSPTYVPTPNDLAAVESYRQFVASETPQGALNTMMGICAESWATESDILLWEPSVVRGALMLCPKAPQAAVLQPRANGEVITDGTYVVGQSIAPGAWKTNAGIRDCYWERTSGGGEIIDNNFISFAPDGATVTIRSGDGGFVSQGCGIWRKVG